jgi:hypothetical protein
MVLDEPAVGTVPGDGLRLPPRPPPETPSLRPRGALSIAGSSYAVARALV